MKTYCERVEEMKKDGFDSEMAEAVIKRKRDDERKHEYKRRTREQKRKEISEGILKKNKALQENKTGDYLNHKVLSEIKNRKFVIIKSVTDNVDEKYDILDIIEHFNLSFNLGNAVKCILKCEYCDDEENNLNKALFYLKRELRNIEEK